METLNKGVDTTIITIDKSYFKFPSSNNNNKDNNNSQQAGGQLNSPASQAELNDILDQFMKALDKMQGKPEKSRAQELRKEYERQEAEKAQNEGLPWEDGDEEDWDFDDTSGSTWGDEEPSENVSFNSEQEHDIRQVDSESYNVSRKNRWRRLF